MSNLTISYNARIPKLKSVIAELEAVHMKAMTYSKP